MATEVTGNTIKILKFIGYIAGGLVLIVLASFVTPKIHDFFYPVKPDTFQHQIDSLKQVEAIAKVKIEMLEGQFKVSQQIISQIDSSIKSDHKSVSYEIKKLHAADNRITLSIRDSITRARQ